MQLSMHLVLLLIDAATNAITLNLSTAIQYRQEPRLTYGARQLLIRAICSAQAVVVRALI